MKKKTFSTLLIAAGCLTVVFIIARVTGALQFYSAPAESNAPAFYPGAHFFATNLKAPSRNRFICFKQDIPVYGAGIWFHRVIGMPGDLVQIRDGEALVNGVDVDKRLSLAHEYCVPGQELNEDIRAWLEAHQLSSFTRPAGADSIAFNCPDAVIEAKEPKARRLILPAGIADSFIYKQYGQPWNPDQFGPVRVPAGHYFLLGDNRHNAMDSRYIGFVAAKDVAGVILGK